MSFDRAQLLNRLRPRRPQLVDVALLVAVGLGLWPALTLAQAESPVATDTVHLVTVVVAVRGALEEFLFRGLVQGALETALHPRWAVLLSAALFAAFHPTVVVAAYAFIVGLAFAVVAHHRQSVVETALAHSTLIALATTLAIPLEPTPIVVTTATLLSTTCFAALATRAIRRIRTQRAVE